MNNQPTSHQFVKADLRSMITCASGIVSLVIFATSAFAQEIEFDIERQATNETLLELAETAGIQIAFAADRARQSTSPAISGSQSVEQALDEALGGTGLDYQFANDDFVVVMADNGLEARPQIVHADNSEVPTLLAQLQEASQADTAVQPTNADESEAEDELEEVVVIGSHIRGGRTASPVISFDRQDIELSGITTTEHFFRSIPQNFGGGAAEESYATNGKEGSRGIYTSGVNLRGLGNGATLVLVNNHRLAPSNVGEGPDVSLIPLGAIDSVDIMTDGASAIYGSDAIAGVVNMVLRKDFTGAETTVRYGDASQGENETTYFNQVFGTAWSSGNALLSYTYGKRAELSVEDRSATADMTLAPHSVLPEKKEQSVILFINQQINDRIDIYADVLYSERDTEGSTIRRVFETYGEQRNINVGTNIDIGNSWQISINALDGKNVNSGTNFFDPDTPFITEDNQYDIQVIDVTADGTVFKVGGGDAKLVLGVQDRREQLNELTDVPIASFTLFDNPKRDSSAVFGELFVPLIGDANGRRGAERLELSIAGRYEDYSDFGSTTNPKVGLAWSPVDGINVRTTWGTSFLAPLLDDVSTVLHPLGASSLLFFDPTINADAPGLLLGGVQSLSPEEASTWTFGIDVRPESLPNLEFSITYFDIEFTDRIDTPVLSADIFDVLVLEDRYGPFIERRPDPADLEASAAYQERVDFWFAVLGFDAAGVPASGIDVLIDNNKTNLARTDESGIDFSLAYDFETNAGDFGLQLAGTYLLEHKFLLTELSPYVDSFNVPYAPVDLKLRGSFFWNRGDFNIGTFVNYVDGYKDTRLASIGDISSWTTVDLNLQYTVNNWDTVFSLSATNVFDREPPFVANNRNLNYDAANTSVIGRYISFGVRKTWW